MIIGIRKELNNINYIDKNIFNKERKIQDEQGNVKTTPLFTEEQLSQPPYNYIKIEVDDVYIDCIGEDFNDDLTFNVEKYNARKLREKNNVRIEGLKQKLFATDYQAIKFGEGELSEEEYAPIRLQRKAWRAEINLLEEK